MSEFASWRGRLLSCRQVLAGSLAFLLLAGSSCRRSEESGKPVSGSKERAAATDPSPDAPTNLAAEAATTPSDSPIETIRRAHELRLRGDLAALQNKIVEEQRAEVIELIQAMDRLLSANQVLQSAVTKRFGPATAVSFDRARAANAIGVFSRDVEAVQERIDGERAAVTVQVGGRVPLDEVVLVRRDGRWLIQTDPPIRGVAEELRNLAEVLVQVASRLESHEMNAVELKRELARREAPVGRRLGELLRANP